jgi:glycosyltransferase involved in cell wall biosynthesis
MRVYCDNIIFSLQRAGGISVYWFELLRRLLRDEVSLGVIEGRNVDDNIFRTKLNLPQQLMVRNLTIPTQIARYLPSFVALSKGCIFHSSYYRVPWGSDCATVVTAYDFTYERFGSGLPRLVHSVQKRIALQKAHGVICISESTKRDLLKFVPGVSEDRIRVIHLGYSDEFRPVQEGVHRESFDREGLHDLPYLVYVGDRSPYKNFQLAVSAVSQVLGYGLVVVGGGKLSRSDQELLDDQLGGRYLHLDRLPNEKLNSLYNSAHALIYPSSYEGFGIPVIEAMAAGCPVIASNTSSIPEAAGNAGLLVDDLSAVAFAACIRELENSSLREAVIQRGFENVKRFSWERCYQETIAFYREILEDAREK